jgi:DNA repair exonuclease SbcCD ATPase subunit|tara:strand:- start:2725 stop:4449 length:1725 start_codon:yes stop_codon:yes gene_type:complete
MIKFTTLRFCNFLSTGDNFTEIDFTDSKSTLVVGHNGAGKSTMLDALSFALFGKPHRNIKKEQMVNSINKKGTVVDVTFDIGGSTYRVMRGIKPNKFEIWKNEIMINQDSNSRDYQKILEQNILKLNHKSFHQIVVLGSSSFIPFMQLASNNRREIIEDLLDINIFSRMNSLLKEKTSVLKDKIKENIHALEIISTKIESQKKYIRGITQINEDLKVTKQKSIENLTQEIADLQTENEKLTALVDELEPIFLKRMSSVDEKLKKINEYSTQFKTEMRSVVKNAKFYEENENCPSCEQLIPSEIKKIQVENAKKRARELQKGIDESNTRYEELNFEQNQLMSQIEIVRNYQKDIHSNTTTTTRLQRSINDIEQEISGMQVENKDLAKANKDLSILVIEKQDSTNTKLKLNDQMQYNGVIVELLKDTGIKTKIIKQYLPVMNNLINQYLQTLDFFVHFDIDESFQETIRSRHRDAFSYASFSEGEKQRIDLALLFTWRMIAKMKNSVATNLLILDETFDSSLDHDGVENLMKILNSLDEDTNVFVISHKGDLLDGKFQNKLEFVKEKNFSKLKKVA